MSIVVVQQNPLPAHRAATVDDDARHDTDKASIMGQVLTGSPRSGVGHSRGWFRLVHRPVGAHDSAAGSSVRIMLRLLILLLIVLLVLFALAVLLERRRPAGRQLSLRYPPRRRRLPQGRTEGPALFVLPLDDWRLESSLGRRRDRPEAIIEATGDVRKWAESALLTELDVAGYEPTGAVIDPGTGPVIAGELLTVTVRPEADECEVSLGLRFSRAGRTLLRQRYTATVERQRWQRWTDQWAEPLARALNEALLMFIDDLPRPAASSQSEAENSQG